MKIKYSSIIATGPNHEIGLNGKIPWKDSEDLLRFQTLTLGKVCIMGKKTYDNLPFRPLKNRINIVLTTDFDLCQESRIHTWELENTLPYYVHTDSRARYMSELFIEEYNLFNEVMICGGKQIYELFVNHTSRIYYTKITSPVASADTFYNVDELIVNGWKTIASQRRETHDFKILERETLV